MGAIGRRGRTIYDDEGWTLEEKRAWKADADKQLLRISKRFREQYSINKAKTVKATKPKRVAVNV